jgi:hypothetical protein
MVGVMRCIKAFNNMAELYQKKVIAFIDILGFKELLNSRKCEEIAEILDIFYSVPLLDRTVYPTKTVSVMSDSLVISFDVRDESGVAYCLSELLLIIMGCMQIGIALRGGIVVGEILHNEKYCFGNGFVKAYQLEKLAKYPRVIVDKEVLKIGIKNRALRHGEDIEKEYITSFLAEDDDGYYYIDYIGEAACREIEDFENGMGYINYLDGIGVTIKNELKKSENIPEIKEKYLWMEKKYEDANANRIYPILESF